MRWRTTLVFVLVTSGVAWLPHSFAKTTQDASTCQFEQVHFSADFPTGKLDECEQLSDNTYRLITRPENTPINPSPWYAFKILNQTDEKLTVNLVVTAEGGPARYRPKQSVDLRSWDLLDYEEAEASFRFSIDLLSGQHKYVAGQEIMSTQMQDLWLQQVALGMPKARLFTLGLSAELRQMNALVHEAESDDWLVLIGRQHPPEITGALALNAFVERLFGDTETAKALRDRLNVLLVPTMNPDGVEHGYWRHTPAGRDMNRDWGERQQSETRALHTYLSHLRSQGQAIRFALDFHSTHKNIFYTMPADYVTLKGERLAEPDLVTAWLAGLNAAIAPLEIPEKPGHNPDSGVFKQYIADEFGVHAVTYEVGDQVVRAQIDAIAIDAFDQLAQQLLGD